MGLLNRIASLFDSRPESFRVPYGTIFQGWVQQLAAHFNADLHWDDDRASGAAFCIHVSGEERRVILLLDGDTVHVRMLSNVNFASRRLPGDVASFLSARNKQLPFFDWDALDNGTRAYFFLKAHGRMDRIEVGTLQEVIEKMLPESIALDLTLEKQGYVA